MNPVLKQILATIGFWVCLTAVIVNAIVFRMSFYPGMESIRLESLFWMAWMGVCATMYYVMSKPKSKKKQ